MVPQTVKYEFPHGEEAPDTQNKRSKDTRVIKHIRTVEQILKPFRVEK